MVPAADRRRPLPAHPGRRIDDAHAALAALAGEERRLERLGLETPLARCRAERRYWSFVAALVALPPEQGR